MDKRLRECVGDGPAPFNEEQHKEIAIYPAGRLSVYICQHGVDFTSGTIAHGNYGFFLPLGDTMPLLRVDRQNQAAQYNHLFPFNPEQAHGLARAEPGAGGDHTYQAKDNIKQAMDFLREHSNREFCLADVAQVANLSPYHFIRTFKA